MDIDLRRKRALAAISASENGDFESAEAEIIDLVSADWNCALAHRAWGRILFDQHRMVDAAESFRMAVSLSPADADLHFELALVLVKQAQSDEYLQLTNWIAARDAVLAGLELDSASSVGQGLLDITEGERQRILA